MSASQYSSTNHHFRYKVRAHGDGNKVHPYATGILASLHQHWRAAALVANTALSFLFSLSKKAKLTQCDSHRLVERYMSTELYVYHQMRFNLPYPSGKQLNERPKKILQYETPAERFDACVASIG